MPRLLLCGLKMATTVNSSHVICMQGRRKEEGGREVLAVSVSFNRYSKATPNPPSFLISWVRIAHPYHQGRLGK